MIRMKKVLLALMALLVIGAPLAIAGPASAASSTAPTTSTPMVARGHSIHVNVNAHGSKVVSRTSTLWQNGHRVYDWSPKPGLYKVKSVIRYQTKTTTQKDIWVPDEHCYGDYDENGDWDPNLDCEDDGYSDYRTATTLGATKSVTRYNYARVHTDETPGCVSHAEFRAVKDGMAQAAVHRMFGTSGHVTNYGSMGTDREYRTCTGDPDYSYVSVDYDPLVSFKWEYVDLT